MGSPLLRERLLCSIGGVASGGLRVRGPSELSSLPLRAGTPQQVSVSADQELFQLPASAPERARRAFTASLQSSWSPRQQALSPKYSAPSTVPRLQGHKASLSRRCHCHFSPARLLEAPHWSLASTPASLPSVLTAPRMISPAFYYRTFLTYKNGKNFMQTTARVGLLKI